MRHRHHGSQQQLEVHAPARCGVLRSGAARAVGVDRRERIAPGVRSGPDSDVTREPVARRWGCCVEGSEQAAQRTRNGRTHPGGVHSAQRPQQAGARERPRERRRVAHHADGDEVLDVGHGPVPERDIRRGVLRREHGPARERGGDEQQRHDEQREPEAHGARNLEAVRSEGNRTSSGEGGEARIAERGKGGEVSRRCLPSWF